MSWEGSGAGALGGVATQSGRVGRNATWTVCLNEAKP